MLIILFKEKKHKTGKIIKKNTKKSKTFENSKKL